MIMIFFTLFPIIGVFAMWIVYYVIDNQIEYYYRTEYSIDQCLEYMKHENIYDIYDYKWEKVEDRYFISLIKYRAYMLSAHFTLNFEVEFKSTDDSTEVRVIYLKSLMAPTPAIGTKYIDLFWKKKLNADKI